MFDRFGEFDSAEELNKAAAGQKAEGDKEALIALAEENGIDREDAEDYFDGNIHEFTNPLLAAMGKLEVEKADLKPEGIMEDWIYYIQTICGRDEPMRLAVRKKGKSLKGCIGALLKWSFDYKKTVDDEIIKAAGIKTGRVELGIPGMNTAHKIITEYYLGGAK